MQVNVFFMHAILHRDCDMFNIVLLVLFSEGQKFSHKNQNYFRRSELFIKGFLYFSHDHITSKSHIRLRLSSVWVRRIADPVLRSSLWIFQKHVKKEFGFHSPAVLQCTQLTP